MALIDGEICIIDYLIAVLVGKHFSGPVHKLVSEYGLLDVA